MPEAVADGLPLGEMDSELLKVPVGDSEELCVTVAEAEGLPLAEGVAVAEAEPVPLGDTEKESL